MKGYYLIVTAVCICSLISGCAIQPKTKPDLSALYAYKPRSILVVPVLNESPEVNASSVFISTITKPLAERGYYVFPVYLTSLILRDFGLAEAGHIHQLATPQLFELFGTDAVLYVTIKEWSTKYIGISSSVMIEMDYELKDAKTSTSLWQSKERVAVQSGGAEGGLIMMIVSAAMHALFMDYLPLAKQANKQAFVPPKGLPAGPYNPDYGRDQDKF